MGLINEDIQETAKLSHGELILALSSFASMPVTAIFTLKKAEIYLLLIHAMTCIALKVKREKII